MTYLGYHALQINIYTYTYLLTYLGLLPNLLFDFNNLNLALNGSRHGKRFAFVSTHKVRMSDTKTRVSVSGHATERGSHLAAAGRRVQIKAYCFDVLITSVCAASVSSLRPR